MRIFTEEIDAIWSLTMGAKEWNGYQSIGGRG
jgi:hypothetical protein